MAKKGYTKIENELFSFLYSNDLSGSELKVLLFLIRYTKGFKRDTCRASYKFIATGINKSEETVRKSIKSLIQKELISIEYPAEGCRAQVVKILYKKLTTLGTRFVPEGVQGLEDDKVQGLYHQDIKKDIKKEDIKKEEKASPTLSLEELAALSQLEDDEDEEEGYEYL